MISFKKVMSKNKPPINLKLKEHLNCGTPDCCGKCSTPDKPTEK